MSRARLIKAVCLLAILMVGGFLLHHRQTIRGPGDVWRLLQETSAGWGLESGFGTTVDDRSPRLDDRLKIASFRLPPNIGELDPAASAAVLADLCLDFDVVALQQVDPTTSPVPAVLQSLEALGRDYRAFADREGHGYAVLFDADTVQLDQSHFYTVHDPESLFSHPPLVAWFRSSLTAPESALTFTLVNYFAPSARQAAEAEILDDLFRAVRDDGRGEDDIILTGDFTAPQITPRARFDQRVQFQTVGYPSSATQPLPVNQFLFHHTASIERGRDGVLNLVRQYNLRVQEVALLVETQPIWIEFSIREGSPPPERPSGESPFPRQWPLKPEHGTAGDLPPANPTPPPTTPSQPLADLGLERSKVTTPFANALPM